MTYENETLNSYCLAVHDESAMVQRIECSPEEFKALTREDHSKSLDVAALAAASSDGAPCWLQTPMIADSPEDGSAHGYGLLAHEEGTIVEWISYSRAEFEAMKVRLAAMRSNGKVRV